MAERRRRWIPIVLGILFLLVCLAIGAGVVAFSMFRHNFDVQTTDAAEASSAFDEVHRRFASRPPLMEIRDGKPHRSRAAAPAEGPAVTLERMRVLLWDPDDKRLARMTIPFWLLRMKTTPIRFRDYANDLENESETDEVTIAELEAHGPGILIDHASPVGQRVLVWLE